jgi:hypothetical protein
VEQLRALTAELESVRDAYDKAIRDLNISPTLINMIKAKVKEERP